MEKILCCLLLLFTNSCVANTQYLNFFNQSLAERKELIHNYSYKEQIDIYLYGINNIHPPPVDLVKSIAENGSEVLPEITSRLKQNIDANEVVGLLNLLQAINDCCYKVGINLELMFTIENKIDAMLVEQWKSWALEIFTDLKN